MGTFSAVELDAIILQVVQPKLESAGLDQNTVSRETSLSDFLDSFALLETLLDIEELTGMDADIGEMDFDKAMTLGGLAEEIARLNN